MTGKLTAALLSLLGRSQSPGSIRQGFRECGPCGRTTAGSLNKDGWLCGECLTPQRRGAAS
ncbi:hypothetical protein ACIGMX_34950 [Streptomyces aquilus]|uniref:hypothetical protein n=1 Tax=Streptomyces aquilus TaxID=2548456 RepID=UPI0037D35750